MAPEVIADGKLYDTKADIWSLGVTCYECATGNPPFAQYEALRAIQLIPKNPPAKLDANQPWSPFMREYLACCLTEDPNERLSAEDLQRTKWIKAHAKFPVTVLRDLITRYGSWVNQGGIRQSIIDVEDSPRSVAEEPSAGCFEAGDSTDDSREFGSESSWDYVRMPTAFLGGC
jgi:serine/threonine-protein kinase 24/25/MST4